MLHQVVSTWQSTISVTSTHYDL